LQLLSEKLGVPVPVGQIRSLMVQHFGEDATVKVQSIVQKASGGWGAVGL